MVISFAGAGAEPDGIQLVPADQMDEAGLAATPTRSTHILGLRRMHIPTRLEASLRPKLSNQPLVILRAWDEQVLDASPEVEATGIRPGDSRCRVEQLCPHAVVLPAREMLYRSRHDLLKSVLANFADKVETGALSEIHTRPLLRSRIPA